MKHVVLTATLVISTFAPAEILLDSSDFPSVLECGANETYTPFSVGAAKGLQVDAHDLPFKGNLLVALPSAGPVTAMRLDVCVDNNGENVTLHRVVERIPGPGFAFSFISNQINVDSPAPNEGLKQALFGDVKNLHMEFKNSASPKDSFLLKGVVLADGQQVVTWSRFDATTGDSLAPTYGGRVRVGTLTQEDPWQPKFTHAKYKVVANGVTILIDFNYKGAPGMYLSYRINSVSIVDPKRGVSFKGGGEDDPHIKINYTHHGLSDTFSFILDQANYTLGDGKLVVKEPGGNETSVDIPDCTHVYKCGLNQL